MSTVRTDNLQDVREYVGRMSGAELTAMLDHEQRRSVGRYVTGRILRAARVEVAHRA